MITLRPYQITAADKVMEAIAARQRLLVVSPGGSGKTVMIAEVARRLAEVGKRTLIVSHRREIVKQTRPTVCVVEGLFYAQNLQTALIMGMMAYRGEKTAKFDAVKEEIVV